ncbi:MAG: type II toxin-antitoxin system HicA family toxin [Chitinophagaceae bacterium]|nr:type II toxin-antitoxin system HicA family toxin [Chitinophagaceae bacterium]
MKKGGWILKRIQGRQHILSHPEKIEIISVPVHKIDDLKKGLQKKLMSIAGLSDNKL